MSQGQRNDIQRQQQHRILDSLQQRQFFPLVRQRASLDRRLRAMLLDLLYFRRLCWIHVPWFGRRYLLLEGNDVERHIRGEVRQQLRLLRKSQPSRISTTTKRISNASSIVQFAKQRRHSRRRSRRHRSPRPNNLPNRLSRSPSQKRSRKQACNSHARLRRSHRAWTARRRRPVAAFAPPSLSPHGRRGYGYLRAIWRYV